MTHATSRRPAVAGLFYPEDPRELVAVVDELLADAAVHNPQSANDPAPKAVIAPHAGYAYSGPVAASAYATLAPAAATITRVVVMGPAHRVALDGIAAPQVQEFLTPLGAVPVDVATVTKLAALPGVVLDDRPHAGEHSIEVHLPFLQRLLPAFTLVPLVVGEVDPATVTVVLDEVWGGPETVIVVSSDLSHYEDHAHAARHDRATASTIVSGAIDRIGPHDACGAVAVQGLVRAAQEHALATALVDLRSSGDTAGPRDRVVGYGAFTVRAGT